jgi:SAM-dependent methyltransferase
LAQREVAREVDFIESSLGMEPQGVLLDLGCGAGSHAVELASRGYDVVGYDLSLFELRLARRHALACGQKLGLLQGDMRQMGFDAEFDAMLCWNATFGYFEEEQNIGVAKRMLRALRPGGTLLLDVTNRDYVSRYLPRHVRFRVNACTGADDVSVDYSVSRLKVRRTLVLEDGSTRACCYSIRLFSLHELGCLLHDVGFRVSEISGHPSTRGAFFGPNSHRIIILAQRP